MDHVKAAIERILTNLKVRCTGLIVDLVLVGGYELCKATLSIKTCHLNVITFFMFQYYFKLDKDWQDLPCREVFNV